MRRSASGATRLTPEEITSRGFASAFRGVSETEVRNFLRRVADELAAARDHERSLAERVADLEAQIRNPPPLDEKQLLDGLGEETTRVLRSAQEAAADIRTRAEQRSAALLEEARDTAKQVRDEADAHATEQTSTAEAAAAERERESIERADAARAAADRDAAETAERATAEADTELEHARESGRAMVEEARAVRERVLTDLSRRRALMQAQLDELRTGREQLLDAYRVVKQTLADAIAALGDVQAKAHADGGIQIEAVPEDGIDFSLDATAAADDAADVPDTSEANAVSGAPPPAEPAGVDRSRAKHETARALPGENPASGAAVDALFARLKGASRPELGTEPVPAATPEAANESEPVSVDLPAEEPTPTASAPVAVAGEIPPELAARDEAVAKVGSALGRRAKRALQDEQNELLDALRKAKGRPTAAATLPSVDQQSAAWADVLAPAVDEVYRTATRTTSPDAKSESVPREVLVMLATELGAPLRDRLESSFSTSSADGDPEDGDVAQRVGSRYREWRAQALDGALADALVGAWAQGTIDAAPDDARLRWVTPAGGCCPDCDDDALEATPRGEAFPTGDRSPPAHPGCRCVIVVETMSVSSAAAGPPAS